MLARLHAPDEVEGVVGERHLERICYLEVEAIAEALQSNTTLTKLSLLGNRTASFRGLPDVFSRPLGSCGAFHCGVGNSGESIIRLRSGEMLLATYGFAADAPNCTSQEEKWSRCYTIALFSSKDGRVWDYTGRIDNTPR